MNCTEIQKLLVEHCLGETRDPTNREIEEHLSKGCRACTEQLREIQGATEAFFASVPSDRIDDERHKKWVEQTLERCRTYGSTSADSLFHEAVSRSENATPPNAVSPRRDGRNSDLAAKRLVTVAAFVASLAGGVLCAAWLPSLLNSATAPQNATAEIKIPAVGEEGFDLGSLPPAALPSEKANRLKASARSEPVFVSRSSSKANSGGSLVILRDNFAPQLHVFGRGFVPESGSSNFELYIRVAGETQARSLGPIVTDENGSFECVVDFRGAPITDAFLARVDR